jgi:hypothetical protein
MFNKFLNRTYGPFINFTLAVGLSHFILQLPIQSVPITTHIVSLNPVHGEVYSIQHYVIKFVSDLTASVKLIKGPYEYFV